MTKVPRQCWMARAGKLCGPDQVCRDRSNQYSSNGLPDLSPFCTVIRSTATLASAQIRDGETANWNGLMMPFPSMPTGSETVPSDRTKRKPCGEMNAVPRLHGMTERGAFVPVAIGITFMRRSFVAGSPVICRITPSPSKAMSD